MKTPLVTVLMPAYNAEKYIGEAIDSILNQTMRDFELIIVNDGSTDNTQQIVRSYTDERIRYFINGENIGIAESFNRAISVARGKYLAIAEHDDISHPQRFKISVSYLEKHSEIDILSSQIESFEGTPPLLKTIAGMTKAYASPMQIKCAAVFGEKRLIHPAQMMRVSALERYDTQYNGNYRICCDFDLFMQLIPFAKMVALSPKLILYRRHSNNASRGINVRTEANNIANKFLQDNFSLDLGAEFFVEGVVSLEYFAYYMRHVELILRTALKNKEYDAALLKKNAGNCAYKCFRLLYKSGIDYQTIFTTYRETELLHAADKKKKFRVYLKHIASKLHLYGG